MVALRNDVLILARHLPIEQWLPLHWLVISASYPFWFNVAKQVGRLFNLQDQITQTQVFGRIKEQYGDREAVTRNARYTMRSFVAWGILKDSETKGCYEKSPPFRVTDPNLAVLMFEAALYAIPDGKVTLSLLLKNPALFPFQIPIISGDFISQHNKRIEVIRYGLDGELLRLKANNAIKEDKEIV